MRYIVIEIQGQSDKTTTIVNDYDDINQAKSRFHAILSAAAVSEVPIHSAALLSDEGKCIKNEFFLHET